MSVWLTSSVPNVITNLELTAVGFRGVLPSNRLQGMCRWMMSHLHDWIDYKGVAFLLELLEWDRTFSGFGGSENSGR